MTAEQNIASGEPTQLPYSDLKSIQSQINDTPFFDSFMLLGTSETDNQSYNLSIGGAICLCLEGKGEILVKQQPVHVSKDDMLILFPHTNVQIMYGSPDFKGYLVCAHESFFKNLSLTELSQTYLSIEENPSIRLTAEEQESVMSLSRRLMNTFNSQHIYRNEISEHLLIVLAYEVAAIYNRRGVCRPTGRHDVYLRDFMRLLVANVTEHRDVAFYANSLCVSPRYLTSTIKKASGQTPAEWIICTTIQKAKELLATTQLSVQQISDKLNFPTPTFFGQYFKHYTNVTPRMFRTARQFLPKNTPNDKKTSAAK